jgi:chlorite dismutase
MAETLTKAATIPAGERPAAVAYSCFWVLQLEPSWYRLPKEERLAAVEQATAVLGAPTPGTTLRAVYSLAGHRHDADLMLWWVGEEGGAFQQLALALNGTTLRAHLRFRELYLGLSRGSTYVGDHVPSFVKQEPPRTYAIVYPFSKTPEWYLLPFERRRELMSEHGAIGRRFDVATNTVHAFGLGDQEFIVALEADDLAELVRCVEELRTAEVRRYTQADTPIYLGRLTPLRAALAALV